MKYTRTTGRAHTGYASASQCRVSACTESNVTSVTEAYKATRWPELFQKSITRPRHISSSSYHCSSGYHCSARGGPVDPPNNVFMRLLRRCLAVGTPLAAQRLVATTSR